MKLFDILYEQDQQDIDDADTYFAPEYKDEADVAAHVYPFLEQKIEKANKKARKLKLPPIELEIFDKYMEKVKTPGTYQPIQVEYYKVKIHGAAPKVEGYKFIATIEHQDGGNIIRTVPDEAGNENIRNFYESKPHYCDHCKKVRKRIDTFIVKEEKTGQLRQVGRNCLADFIGGTDPKAILWYFSQLNNFFQTVGEAEEEATRKGARVQQFVELPELLAGAAAIIDKFGYVSAKASEERGIAPTSSIVRELIFNRSNFAARKNESEEYKRMMLDLVDNPPAAQVKHAETVIRWFKSLPKEQVESNEFMHNLSVIVNSGRVNARNVGYAVAIFPAYMRAMNLLKQKEKQPSKSNEWIGQPGQKLPPTKIKVIRTRMISGQFGPTQIVTMEDEQGNVFVWFNNSAKKMSEDGEGTIVGTIKKHDEFNGRKQTHLTRVKLQ